MLHTRLPKVLLTGAFGNIGQHTLELLLKHEYPVQAFDVDTKINKKIARRFDAQVLWGDIGNYDDIFRAMDGVDAVIHLAAIIPPKSEENPGLSYGVNVQGTKNIIRAMMLYDTKHLVYASSVAVHGRSYERPMLFIDYPLVATDHYSAQKIECENYLAQVKVNSTVLRFGGATFPFRTEPHPSVFDISLDAKLEMVHPKDAATAAVNALFNEETYGKRYFIGGGSEFQMTYGEYLQKILESIGLEMLPEEAFGNDPFHTNYMDTAEAQRILRFQNHSFDDFLRDSKKDQGLNAYVLMIPGAGFFARKKLLALSQHYKQK